MSLLQTQLVAFKGNEHDSTHAKKNNKDAKTKESQVVRYKKDRNPDRIANSMGVVAGTNGMVGGSIIGGLVGAFKLPFEAAKTAVNQDYGAIVGDSLDVFKKDFVSNPSIEGLKNGLLDLGNEFKSTNSAEAAEEILNILNTMSGRLHETFKNDEAAKNVIDKVIDPLVSSVSLNHNKKSLIGVVAKAIFSKGKTEESTPKMLAILKGLGFPIKTTTITANVMGNFAKGVGECVDNIQTFTPEEKEAWGKVAKQITNELEKNPKIQKSKNIINHLTNIFNSAKELFKDADWINKPLKGIQKTLTNGIEKASNNISLEPVKTIGKYAIIGSLAGGLISVLGWYGLKKALMHKNKDE